MKSFFAIFSIVIFASCSKYYTAGDFVRVAKIDTHIHINTESTAFAEQAKADNFLLLTVNVDAPPYPELPEQMRLARLQKEMTPDRIQFLSAFSLGGWDSLWTQRTLAKLHADFQSDALGIKIWKNIGMTYRDSSGQFIMIDDPRFDSVVNYVIREGKTVMGHLGEPKNCWLPLDQMTVNNDRSYFRDHPEYHMFLHPEYPSYEKQISARDHFLERHPDMRFVGAHLGSLEWDVEELAKRLDRFPNMAVDVAARVPHLQYQSQKDYDKVRKFMIAYQDRIVYGSDSEMEAEANPEEARQSLHKRWLADWNYFTSEATMTAEEVNGEFKGLKLPAEVVDKLYYHNARRWFKIP